MSFTVVSGRERRHNMLRTCSKREIVTASETAVWNGLRSEDAELTRLIREHGPMNLERAYEVMNTGVGGSAHIEDLMLITAEGAEPLHEIGKR